MQQSLPLWLVLVLGLASVLLVLFLMLLMHNMLVRAGASLVAINSF